MAICSKPSTMGWSASLLGFIFLEPMLSGAPGLEHRLVSVNISR